MATTTYMVLTLPDPGVTAGPTWASQLNTALELVDSHDHSTEKGTPVTPSGLNINVDLPFNGNSATALKTACFQTQGTSLSSAFQRCVYAVGNDLYYNNGSGTAIQLTTGSSINVSSVNGISGLAAPASAAFSTPDFVFKSDSTTYGKIAASDLKIFPYVGGATSATTIKASTSIAASYSLTLPDSQNPGATGYLKFNSGGVAVWHAPDDIAAAMSSTGSNSIASVRTRLTGTSVSAGGVAISNSSGSYSTASTSYVDVTNLSVTITTSGRPVFVGLIPEGGSTDASLGCFTTGTTATAIYKIVRDGSTDVSTSHVYINVGGGTSCTNYVPPSSVSAIDVVGAGTYTYKLQTRNLAGAGPLSRVGFCKLIAYEL